MKAWIPCALLVLAATACSGPSFTYSGHPDVDLTRFRDVGLDPRKDIMVMLDGKRAVDIPEARTLVMAQLEAKGYRIVPPDQAQLWLEVFTLHPIATRYKPPPSRNNSADQSGAKAGRAAGDQKPVEFNAPLGNLGVTVVVQLVDCATKEVLWSGILDQPLPRPEPHKALTPMGEVLAAPLKELMDPLSARRPSRP
jgi:hypothetical protein